MALVVAMFVFTFLVVLSVAEIAVTWFMAGRLIEGSGIPDPRRWLTRWSIRGLAVPVGLWALMNVRISWRLQPFMPQIQAAMNRGAGWFPVFLGALAGGLFIIGSYWASVTLAWTLARAGSRLEGENRSQFRSLCLACGFGLLLPAAGLIWLGGWAAAGFAAFGMLAPIAGYAPGMLNMRKLPPMYARAVAKLKFGKYAEAEQEIIHQLEQCENDFQGWMMMAELYALHFHDLPEAEQTVLEICDQPNVSPSQFSVALHRLADWHLNPGNNPEAA